MVVQVPLLKPHLPPALQVSLQSQWSVQHAPVGPLSIPKPHQPGVHPTPVGTVTGCGSGTAAVLAHVRSAGHKHTVANAIFVGGTTVTIWCVLLALSIEVNQGKKYKKILLIIVMQREKILKKMDDGVKYAVK